MSYILAPSDLLYKPVSSRPKMVISMETDSKPNQNSEFLPSGEVQRSTIYLIASLAALTFLFVSLIGFEPSTVIEEPAKPTVTVPVKESAPDIGIVQPD
jgi:hypothetical protein